jgi:mono/diheme cytochrome c family protein
MLSRNLISGVAVAALALLAPAAGRAQRPAPAASEVTFAKDIAPILQRSCQNCHRPNGVAPMSLVTYEEVRPWARSIKTRTGIGPRAGVMPPWYIEKNIGIQHYKDDPSLSDEEVAKIAKWADSGAPLGNPADLPPARVFEDDRAWRIGQPDLIVKMAHVEVKGDAPDWWGEVPSVPTGLTEDRYVAAIEIKEVNDVKPGGDGRHTVGGRYVIHHMIWGTRVPNAPEDPLGGFWPVHEVGRNPDFFDPDSGRLLKAGTELRSDSVHLHSNGRDTKAHLEIGFKFHPKGYKPKLMPAFIALGNGVDIDIKPMEAGQQLHAYAVLQQHTKVVTFEPHLHAPGMRMCLEAIWGFNIETLTCAGYDHNWVRGYAYDDDHAPLLPKGTILHIIGYMDNSPANKNIPDPRNWQGSGNRSVANMFIDLGMRVALTDEQFEAEMAKRRAKLNLTRNDHVVGCPLCNVGTAPAARPANAAGANP